MELTTLKVNEIFYSLQGEGKRSGEATIFIRLSGCNLECPFCDTKGHEDGRKMSISYIAMELEQIGHNYIVWTGGEPLKQLTTEILRYFNKLGYRQGIETNGTIPLDAVEGIVEHLTISPKKQFEFFGEGSNTILLKNESGELKISLSDYASVEIRLPVDNDTVIPKMPFVLDNVDLYLSPIFDKNNKPIQSNIDRCVCLCKMIPQWKLSLQIHKIINIP